MAILIKEGKTERDAGYSYHAKYLIEGTQSSFLIGYVMLKGEEEIPTKFADGLLAQGETGGEYSVKVIRMDKDRYQFVLPIQTGYLSDLTACRHSLDLAEMMQYEIEATVQKILENNKYYQNRVNR